MLPKSLFGPLNKKYCDYFYFFSVAGFIVMIMFVLFTLVICLRFYKKLDSKIMINLIMMIVNSFLLYFSNRLLYTMCVKSL